jgi:hypothetical protein
MINTHRNRTGGKGNTTRVMWPSEPKVSCAPWSNNCNNRRQHANLELSHHAPTAHAAL